MSTVRIFDNNFIDAAVLANYNTSSENTAFPVENTFFGERRRKVWRSNGYFNVTASNNTIIFRDYTGVDITATIATAEYTSASTFMTAVQAALTAVGGSVYTVTQSSNFKFVITSTLAGVSLFELRFDNALAYGAADLLGFERVAMTGLASYTSDVIIINSGEWILLDMGISSNPTQLVIIGSNRNKPLKFSPTAVVTLEANPTDNFTAPVYSQVITGSDYILAHMTTTGIFVNPMRYWRIKMQDQNPNGYLEIGSLYLGTHYEPIRGAAQFPLSQEKQDKSIITISEGGVPYADERDKTQSFTLTWNLLTTAEKENIEFLYEQKFGLSTPFFMSLDTNQVFSVNNLSMIKYVRFLEDPVFNLTSPNLWDCSMKVREEL